MLISACAAIMSVAGLTTIFKGSPLVVTLMGSILEFAKVLISIYTHLYWDKAKKLLIAYLSFALVILMFITSLGIYGYLSKAYLTSTDTGIGASRIESLQVSLEIEKGKIKMITDQIGSINSVPKEEKTGWHFARVRQLSREMDTVSKRMDEINMQYSEEKTKVSIIEAEVGPLKYLAGFIYGTADRESIDKSVQIFILMIVLVFDPLAILLIIAGISAQAKEEKIIIKPVVESVAEELKPVETPSDPPKTVTEMVLEEKPSTFIEQTYRKDQRLISDSDEDINHMYNQDKRVENKWEK